MTIAWIAGNTLESYLLQHKDETSLSVIVLKKVWIGQSAAKPRIEEGSETKYPSSTHGLAGDPL